jgi:hypothetical protein
MNLKGVFMTRKEAERALEAMEHETPSWFCPVIKGQCKRDCVNFYEPFILNTKNSPVYDADSNDFEIGGFFCTNSQFSGLKTSFSCPSCGTSIVIGQGQPSGSRN